MFRPVILMVLFRHVHAHVAATWFFCFYMNGEMVLQGAAVPKMAVCVTFGASRSGAKFCNICAPSEYVTFSTISATAVRNMTVCVTFGALHFGFPVATWRHPAVDHIGNVLHGSDFRKLRR